MPVTPWSLYLQQNPDTMPDDSQNVGPDAVTYRGPASAPAASPPAVARVKPQPKGSGGKQMATDTNRINTLRVENVTVPESPDQILAHYNAIKALPAIQEQEAGADSLRDALTKQLQRPVSPDIAGPLGQLANYVSRGQYAVPKAVPQGLTTDKVIGLLDKAQDDKRDVTRQISQLMSATKSAGSLQNKEDAQTVAQTQIGFQDPNTTAGGKPNNFDPVNYDKWVKHVDDITKNATSAAMEAKLLQRAVNGNPTAQREVPIILTRMLTGSSRQPVQEVLMAKGDPSFMESAAQRWSTLAGGKMTDTNKQQYLDFAKDILNHHQENLKYLRDMSTQTGLDGGIDSGKVGRYIKLKFDPLLIQADKAAASKAAPAPATGNFTPEMEARYQELLKKSQGK